MCYLYSHDPHVLIIKRDRIIDNPREFARIDQRRKAINLSISQLCRLAKLSRTAYYKWKKGRGMMPENLQVIENVLVRMERLYHNHSS